MGSKAHLLLLGLLCTLLCCSHVDARRQRGQRDREDGDFDFFYFVRQWPGSFCSEHACPLLKDRSKPRFTIHGLWPNYAEGGWPQFCDNTQPFDEEEVEDLEEQLAEAWPSFMDNNSNQNFWAHEWNKHGTCSLNIFRSEHDFFKGVLQLYKQYDLYAALSNAGIVPSDNHYSKEEVMGAIKGAFGVEALVHCSQNGQLTEVWMCIGKDLKAVDCQVPPTDARRCKEVTLEPIPGSAGESQKALPAAAAGAAASNARTYKTTAAPPGRAIAVAAAGAVMATILMATIAAAWSSRQAINAAANAAAASKAKVPMVASAETASVPDAEAALQQPLLQR